MVSYEESRKKQGRETPIFVLMCCLFPRANFIDLSTVSSEQLFLINTIAMIAECGQITFSLNIFYLYTIINYIHE